MTTSASSPVVNSTSESPPPLRPTCTLTRLSIPGRQKWTTRPKTTPWPKSVDLVNVQTYDGGISEANNVQEWIHSVDFKPSQILFGIVSEEG